MSTPPFSLRVRLGNYEIEISGTREEVLKALEDLPTIVNKVSQAFVAMTSPIAVSLASQAPTTEGEQPAVAGAPYPPIQQAKSCSEAISQLLYTNWGKEKPRTLSDVTTALEANALHYPIATVAKTLERLTRKNKLRRWKTEEGYVYVLA